MRTIQVYNLVSFFLRYSHFVITSKLQQIQYLILNFLLSSFVVASLTSLTSFIRCGKVCFLFVF